MSGHTPGPWTQGSGARADCVWLDGHREPLVGMGDESTWIDCNTPANARLIAASPVGLEAAELAYAALIAHQRDAWRLQNQHVYCALRDFIAKARGLSEEEVQDAAESTALAEATGEQS